MTLESQVRTWLDRRIDQLDLSSHNAENILTSLTEFVEKVRNDVLKEAALAAKNAYSEEWSHRKYKIAGDEISAVILALKTPEAST